MATYEYITVDVFTAERFGGNPLAVFLAADGIDPTTQQALAAEMNYSETVFVLQPQSAGNTARLRIYNRTAEMPFAGHPNVGTAFALARLGLAGEGGALRFEQPAGLVEVRLLEEQREVVGAEIGAPRPLEIGGSLPAADVAACLSLPPTSMITLRHSPLRASVGVEFVLAEAEPDALKRAAPDLNACRRLAAAHEDLGDRLAIMVWADDAPGIRARMFAPLAGTWEDPATGSANAALAALRLSLSDAESLRYECAQGVELGRPSRLHLHAWRDGDGVRASVGGRCVVVFRGSITL